MAYNACLLSLTIFKIDSLNTRRVWLMNLLKTGRLTQHIKTRLRLTPHIHHTKSFKSLYLCIFSKYAESDSLISMSAPSRTPLYSLNYGESDFLSKWNYGIRLCGICRICFNFDDQKTILNCFCLLPKNLELFWEKRIHKMFCWAKLIY